MPINQITVAQPLNNPASTLPTYAGLSLEDPFKNVKIENEKARVREEASQSKQQSRQDSAYAAMIKDPSNAEYISQAYGVEITPELAGLLKEPQKAQKMLEAAELADKSGIKNYEAKKIFVQKYLESGNMVEAGAALDGIDTREQMTPYQEQMIDVYRNRDANKKEKLRTVPTNFPDIAGSQLDLLRGVQWADPKKPGKGLISGSAGPLDPQTKAALVAKASAYYQESGNAIDAVQRAFQDIGGESGLSDGAEAPFENADGGWNMPWDDNFKYKTMAPTQGQQELPLATAAKKLIQPPTAPAPPGRVRVQALDGTIGTIDESELFDAEIEGYKVIR